MRMKVEHSKPPSFLTIEEIEYYDLAVDLGRSYGVRHICFVDVLPNEIPYESRKVVTTYPKDDSDMFAFAMRCAEAREGFQDPPSERAISVLWNAVHYLKSIDVRVNRVRLDEAIESFLGMPSDNGKPAEKKEMQARRSDLRRMLSEYGLGRIKAVQATK